MKGSRHPHPHVDPRSPRHESKPGTNPPVFVWKPPDGATGSAFVVARDAGLTDVVLREEGLADSAYLPERAFEPGRYFWKWSGEASEGEVFSFEITPEAVVLEVPPAAEWLRRFPSAHPRINIRPEEVAALRESRGNERAEFWQALRAAADELLAQPHELAEPPFLPDRDTDYEKRFAVWHRILRESRAFVSGAQTLGLAYLASGEAKYGRAACQRMASVSCWDPMGSSHLSHNDEAHMSVIWCGPQACDWAWDQFTDEERERVIEQFRRRGQINYDHMHSRGCYGVTRFDSHAGREIVFLAQIALVFHEHIPEAAEWLEWLRPVLCGIWPVWAGDDGGWAEGLSYGLAYVGIMTMFASALKRGAGVDLYRRSFWHNHPRWRMQCMPPYAEWIGFGDHSERWAGSWQRSADLVDLIDRETGMNEFSGYVAALREEARLCERRAGFRTAPVSYQNYLAPPARDGAGAPRTGGMLQVFPAVGWATVRTDLAEPSRDIAFIFRSSPLGAVSHSHANNNDFIIHVAGKVMTMPSGYYAGYGSDHHAHWVWHTKSHNCVTLSDASQLMRSHDSTGAVVNAFEDERLVYFCGNADASYRDRAERCRRHVVFLKARQCFVMIDEFVRRRDVASCLQWNVHSWEKFCVDEDKRAFLLERAGRSLEGHFMYHHNAFFTLTEGWDPPPQDLGRADQRDQQYHLRFTVSGVEARQRTLGVVFCPGHASLTRATVHTERSGDTEVARIGDDLVLVNQGTGVECDGLRSDALALLVVEDRRYEVGDAGIAASE